MLERFNNRIEAGHSLAERLSHYRDKPGGIVLALPRGGVPVAYAVAHVLRLPLDLFFVRKLGVPGHEEFAMGAIASGGVTLLNDDIVKQLHIPDSEVRYVIEREQRKRRGLAGAMTLGAIAVKDRPDIAIERRGSLGCGGQTSGGNGTGKNSHGLVMS